MGTDDEILQLKGDVARHEAITTMIAGITHDLATPIGIMNQAASIIADAVKESKLDALAKDADARETLGDVAEAARLILASAERARALVHTFKNVAVRELTERLESVDLNALLHEVVGLYRYQARSSQLEMVVAAPEEAPWRSYPNHFTRVVLNLLSNVDRYAYPDGDGGRVDIALERQRGGYRLSVRDHGAGMSDAQRAKIFEPFYTTGQDRGGTGLGMAIVADLVTNRLRGTVEVKSEWGVGTTVEVWLPEKLDEQVDEEESTG